MKKKFLGLLYIFSILMIASFSFVNWMSNSQFKQNYKEIKEQYYTVISNQMINKIQESLKYGKTIESFYGINDIFNQFIGVLGEENKVYIMSKEGKVLYKSDNEPISSQDYELMTFDIMNEEDKVGSLVLAYPSYVINKEVSKQNHEGIKLLIMITLLCLMALFGCIYFVGQMKKEDKRLVFLMPMLIIVLGTITQSSLTYMRYQQKYTSSMLEGANSILKSVSSDLELLHDKGLEYNQMQGLAEYLAQKVNETPILWSMRVNKTIYDTDNVLNRQSDMIIQQQLGENEDDTENIFLQMEISEEYLKDKLMMLLLVFLATMLVVIIIVWEMMRLPEQLLFRKSEMFNQNKSNQYEILTDNIRSINFLMFTAIYVSMPYSAVLIRKWGIGIGNMSADMLASVPMTIELFGLMIFSLVFASLLKKIDLKVGTIIFGGLIVVGNLCCAYATHPIFIIINRIICSAGLAGMKYLINNIITLGSENKERTSRHIAQMNAGTLGGIMCGGSLGGIISDSIGVNNTFLFSMVTALLVIIMAIYTVPWKLLKANKQNSQEKGEVSKEQRSGTHEVKEKLLFNKEIIGYMLFVAFPLYLGLMFLVAFIPSFVQKKELPIILVSYAYLVNGMLGIYAGPFIGNVLNKKISRKGTVTITLLIGAISMFIIKLPWVVSMILVSSGLMGLFDGFGTPEVMNQFIELDVVKKKMNSASALAVLGVFGSAVGMVSPMIYTWAIDGTLFSVNGIICIAAAYLLCSVLFLLTSKQSRIKA